MENADFVLYVSANLKFAQCAPGGAALAFAAPCQLEKQYDRFTCIVILTLTQMDICTYVHHTFMQYILCLDTCRHAHIIVHMKCLLR